MTDETSRAVPAADHDRTAEATQDLALAYAQRWEIENTFDELKTHQRGPRQVLRSKPPLLVQQEIWGHLCCHYAIRTLMVDAARASTRPRPSCSSQHYVSPDDHCRTALFPPYPQLDRTASESRDRITAESNQPRTPPPRQPVCCQTQSSQTGRQTRPPSTPSTTPEAARMHNTNY